MSSITEKFGVNTQTWVEIDEETYDWLFGCVPPLMMRANSFLNSEPNSHIVEDGDWVANYFACRQVGDKYEAKFLTIKGYRKEC